MTPKQRLQKLAAEVKTAGLAGKSMQDKLAELVEKHDLTGHDIQRIAEMANRDVQLELYKTAADKRFKFNLADPGPLKTAARKTAESVAPATGMHKVAAAIEQSGGDPFAVPYRTPKNFSLYDHPMDEKIAENIEDTEMRATLQGLDKIRLEYEALRRQGEAELVKVAENTQRASEAIVQHALDLLMGGVTFSSLYQAMMAAVGGGKCSEEDRKNVDALALRLLAGLKQRGVQNHRLGFKHRGNVAALDKLTAEEILVLAKNSLGQIQPQDLKMEGTKQANYAEKYIKTDGDTAVSNLLNEANFYMKNRPTQLENPCPQVYLDNTDNLPGGTPRVINTDNQFVVAVKDLMGDQGRMVRLHSANEYIGLKLQQIEQAMRDLAGARKTATTTKESGLMSNLATQVKDQPLQALGIAGSVMAGMGGPVQQILANRYDAKVRAEARREKRKQEAEAQRQNELEMAHHMGQLSAHQPHPFAAPSGPLQPYAKAAAPIGAILGGVGRAALGFAKNNPGMALQAGSAVAGRVMNRGGSRQAQPEAGTSGQNGQSTGGVSY